MTKEELTRDIILKIYVNDEICTRRGADKKK